MECDKTVLIFFPHMFGQFFTDFAGTTDCIRLVLLQQIVTHHCFVQSNRADLFMHS